MIEPLSILLSGMIASTPHQAGATWAVLQYLLGLRRLGHRVTFVEPVEPAVLRADGRSIHESECARYFRRVMEQFGLTEDAALLLAGTRETVGIDYEKVLASAQSADLLINISGMLTDEALLSAIARRVYLDLDPAFNQLWQAVEGIDMRFAAHTLFVTVGLALGAPDCTVPTCGLPWHTTVPPVVLNEWPACEELTSDALTTIANWRGYGSIYHDGVLYGQKVHSLRRIIELPRLTRERFSLALAIHPDETRDLQALRENGWELLDPLRVAGTPDDYRRFVQGSRAEFGIAKSGYVASRCGWFSDRSACYLASGRPVIAQETGFSAVLQTGEGLFAFEDAGQVASAIDALRSNYGRHATAARALAEASFDSDRVLTRLVELAGA